MIVYVKQSEKIEFLHKVLNIFKMEKLEDKAIIYVPINEKAKKEKLKKLWKN